MTCNLRCVGAFAALSLSRLTASGLPSVPTIVVTDPAEPAGLAKVVFAPPALIEPPRPSLRFTIAPTELAGTGSMAATVMHPGAFLKPQARVCAAGDLPAPSAGTARSPAAAASGDVPARIAAVPSVSFALPPYEATRAERETIAACLVLEAASQGDFGMRAVMSVIRNRARGLPELFATNVLRPNQFSALNKVTTGRESLTSAINRAKRDRVWPVALAIVDDALQHTWNDPTDGATHYTRSAERTHWTRSLAKTTTIGAHSFYR